MVGTPLVLRSSTRACRLHGQFRIAILACLLAGLSCSGQTNSGSSASRSSTNASTNAGSLTVREPAVAGLFYPANSNVLARTVQGLLARAPTHYVPRLRALICPHAGYEYSGAIAAAGYKILAGRAVSTVVLLAPSHYADFDGASLPRAQAYRSPLGLVPVSAKCAALARTTPFVVEPACMLERPAWWRQASKPAPAVGQDTPETWEHSAEVQLPFLQSTVSGFNLVPVILGRVDPEQLARALAPVLDDRTIVLASSDLSHYHPDTAARMLDSRCVRAICDLDIEQMKKQEACGKGPILSLLHLARLKGWKAQLLATGNSGDVTADKDRVVGYAGIAFYAPGQDAYGTAERQLLLELARQTVTSTATNGSLPEPKDLPARLQEKHGCFVTLTKSGELRGCIGSLIAQSPLYRAIIDNARNAAARDPRFPPVQRSELEQIRIEISVLTEPKPLAFSSPEDLLQKLKPWEDGVLLQIGPHLATFLPQVWAQLPDKVSFLEHLSQKAGCAPEDWRGKDASVSTYRVECFEEPEPVARN